MRDILSTPAAACAEVALISRQTATSLGADPKQTIFLTLSDGSDCVIAATVSSSQDDACIALTEAQLHNLHVKPGFALDVTLFHPNLQEGFKLVDVELEVSVIGSPGPPVSIDGGRLAGRFLRDLLGLVVATNEVFIFPLDELHGHATDAESLQLVLTVRECNTLDEAARQDAVRYHCYRGIVGPDTAVYTAPLRHSPAASTENMEPGESTAQSTASGRRQVALANPVSRPPARRSAQLVDVHTNDGEVFPVHRRLLRPCISLTKVVRAAGEGEAAAHIDVDTLTFDRVLVFLESEAVGREPPAFGVHVVPPLLDAARTLGLRSLCDYCEKRLGDSAARRRWHSFAEIERRNAAGERLLIMDGMVFDVTRWLPEHPGGDTIIPKQALNLDSSRFFEVYHASRESFLYLGEFYAGEVAVEELAKVPRPPHEPSDDFLRQLRDFMAGFRLEGAEVVREAAQRFKSF